MYSPLQRTSRFNGKRTGSVFTKRKSCMEITKVCLVPIVYDLRTNVIMDSYGNPH